jgi:3-oxoacyl-[acyl-carrier protein] reductase
MSLKNNVVIVTGGATGIGREISLRLARDGYFVLINFNSSEAAAQELKKEILSTNGEAEILGFDVKNSTQVEEKLQAFFELRPELHIYGLVNNAGISKDTVMGLMSDEDFQSVMETNVYGAFYLTRWAVKKMLLKKKGVIINMSSLSGQTGNAGQFNYSASKAALIAMTKSLAQEVGRKGIRVNAVSPGIIETKMIEDVQFLQDMKNNIPLRRFGEAREVASAVSFLVSTEASYITGQTLSVNGGLFCS